jgi:acetyl-CoA C-acetyltransferase
VPKDFGPFPKERMNPNGGSTALGHPFGATGRPHHQPVGQGIGGHAKGSRAIVSICADGGQGSVLLLEAA